MPPCTAQFLALNGHSNLRPRMLAIQATWLLHLLEATTDPALSQGRNLQGFMPVHNCRVTTTLILHRTQAGAMALTARPAQRSGLLTNHMFSLACLLLAARTLPQNGRHIAKAVLSAQSAMISSIEVTALLKDLSFSLSNNMPYVP